jgi:hypothetical protein
MRVWGGNAKGSAWSPNQKGEWRGLVTRRKSNTAGGGHAFAKSTRLGKTGRKTRAPVDAGGAMVRYRRARLYESRVAASL